MQHKSEHHDDQKTHSESEKILQKRASMNGLAARLKAYLEGVSDDESSFDEFVRAFIPKFNRLFLRKGLVAMEAADLAQSCAADIALKAHRYQVIEHAGFQAWVFKLALHALADWSKGRLLTVPLENIVPLSADGTRTERRRYAKAVPDQKVIAAVADALAQLKPSDRQLIELRDFIANHSYEEIAKLLQRTPNALKTHHHRLLKKLKAILERDPRMHDWLNRAQKRAKKVS